MFIFRLHKKFRMQSSLSGLCMYLIYQQFLNTCHTLRTVPNLQPSTNNQTSLKSFKYTNLKSHRVNYPNEYVNHQQKEYNNLRGNRYAKRIYTNKVPLINRKNNLDFTTNSSDTNTQSDWIREFGVWVESFEGTLKDFALTGIPANQRHNLLQIGYLIKGIHFLIENIEKVDFKLQYLMERLQKYVYYYLRTILQNINNNSSKNEISKKVDMDSVKDKIKQCLIYITILLKTTRTTKVSTNSENQREILERMTKLLDDDNVPETGGNIYKNSKHSGEFGRVNHVSNYNKLDDSIIMSIKNTENIKDMPSHNNNMFQVITINQTHNFNIISKLENNNNINGRNDELYFAVLRIHCHMSYILEQLDTNILLTVPIIIKQHVAQLEHTFPYQHVLLYIKNDGKNPYPHIISMDEMIIYIKYLLNVLEIIVNTIKETVSLYYKDEMLTEINRILYVIEIYEQKSSIENNFIDNIFELEDDISTLTIQIKMIDQWYGNQLVNLIHMQKSINDLVKYMEGYNQQQIYKIELIISQKNPKIEQELKHLYEYKTPLWIYDKLNILNKKIEIIEVHYFKIQAESHSISLMPSRTGIGNYNVTMSLDYKLHNVEEYINVLRHDFFLNINTVNTNIIISNIDCCITELNNLILTTKFKNKKHQIENMLQRVEYFKRQIFSIGIRRQSNEGVNNNYDSITTIYINTDYMKSVENRLEYYQSLMSSKQDLETLLYINGELKLMTKEYHNFKTLISVKCGLSINITKNIDYKVADYYNRLILLINKKRKLTDEMANYVSIWVKNMVNYFNQKTPENISKTDKVVVFWINDYISRTVNKLTAFEVNCISQDLLYKITTIQKLTDSIDNIKTLKILQNVINNIENRLQILWHYVITSPLNKLNFILIYSHIDDIAHEIELCKNNKNSKILNYQIRDLYHDLIIFLNEIKKTTTIKHFQFQYLDTMNINTINNVLVNNDYMNELAGQLREIDITVIPKDNTLTITQSSILVYDILIEVNRFSSIQLQSEDEKKKLKILTVNLSIQLKSLTYIIGNDRIPKKDNEKTISEDNPNDYGEIHEQLKNDLNIFRDLLKDKQNMWCVLQNDLHIHNTLTILQTLNQRLTLVKVNSHIQHLEEEGENLLQEVETIMNQYIQKINKSKNVTHSKTINMNLKKTMVEEQIYSIYINIKIIENKIVIKQEKQTIMHIYSILHQMLFTFSKINLENTASNLLYKVKKYTRDVERLIHKIEQLYPKISTEYTTAGLKIQTAIENESEYFYNQLLRLKTIYLSNPDESVIMNIIVELNEMVSTLEEQEIKTHSIKKRKYIYGIVKLVMTFRAEVESQVVDDMKLTNEGIKFQRYTLVERLILERLSCLVRVLNVIRSVVLFVNEHSMFIINKLTQILQEIHQIKTQDIRGRFINLIRLLEEIIKNLKRIVNVGNQNPQLKQLELCIDSLLSQIDNTVFGPFQFVKRTIAFMLRRRLISLKKDIHCVSQCKSARQINSNIIALIPKMYRLKANANGPIRRAIQEFIKFFNQGL